MPSQGDLFSEADRESIRLLESSIHEDYSSIVMQVAKRRLVQDSASIVLDSKQLYDADVPKIKDMLLSESKAVQTLNLRGNVLTSEGVSSLLLSPGSSLPSTLTSLDLSDNALELGTFAASILNSGKLSTLRLSKCSLSDPEIKTILAAVSPSLNVLDVSDNAVGDEASDAVYNLLSRDNSLAVLNLAKCGISDVHGVSCASGLR